ncbi:hypothetical protein BH20ACT19_BH20ACT19_08320 [soil metagenome]
MTTGPPLRRLPIESQRPIIVFGWARLALALLTLALVTALGFPYSGRLAVVVAGLVLPWSLANVLLAQRSPRLALSPIVALGDVIVLAAIEAVAPETYGAVRFMAIAILAVHAHLQGERIGLLVATLAIAILLPLTALNGPEEIEGRLRVLYETMFAVALLAAVTLVGGFRTAESASRLRARELTRRAMRSESDVRREVSEALHDGPVQELIGLDMMLSAAEREAARERAPRTAEMLGAARESASRNLTALRDEMIGLGPHGFDELSFQVACERCIPTWRRRYAIDARLEVEPHELPSEAEGDLFRITQEALVNAARHGEAKHALISLTFASDRLELKIDDDGNGFSGSDPLGLTEAGHMGIAGMRERAALLQGTLRIESSAEGTTVTVNAPVPDGR